MGSSRWAIGLAGLSLLVGGCIGARGVDGVVGDPSRPPTVTLDVPAAGASRLSGHVDNVDTRRAKVVVYVLTNVWWVQPWANAPFTDIGSDGSWSSDTHRWNRIAVLLVDPARYTPAATLTTHPALDPLVLAWTEYPSTGPSSVEFAGRRWGIKVSSTPFDPGPNRWSNDPSVVHVAADGLHLKAVRIGGQWQCGEVHLLESLGYGTYTVRVRSRLDGLDRNTVASPLFIYASPGRELDVEYSGTGGLIPAPDNAQYVVQPWEVAGNTRRYVTPAVDQLTARIEWYPDHVAFRTWRGWSTTPSAGDVIQEWRYTGADIPAPGPERVRINLWLLNGSAPLGGVGDELIVDAFSFEP